MAVSDHCARTQALGMVSKARAVGNATVTAPGQDPRAMQSQGHHALAERRARPETARDDSARATRAEAKRDPRAGGQSQCAPSKPAPSAFAFALGACGAESTLTDDDSV